MNTKNRKANYETWAKEFKMYCNELVAATSVLPDVYDVATVPESGITTRDDRLYSIAKRIDDVLESFDALQKALGLPKGDTPRHERFLKGKCHD